jgi:hypothetical protein
MTCHLWLNAIEHLQATASEVTHTKSRWRRCEGMIYRSDRKISHWMSNILRVGQFRALMNLS